MVFVERHAVGGDGEFDGLQGRVGSGLGGVDEEVLGEAVDLGYQLEVDAGQH
ncbi:hypothetical protein ACIPUC_31715 [Streptomyces sp. LARHCF249]